jgi:hypothetical protein
VILTAAEGTGMNLYAMRQVGPDGGFTFSSVPPGEHILGVLPGVRSPGGSATASTIPEFGRIPLTVAGSDLTNLLITTKPCLPVSGHVTYQGGAPPPVLGGAFRIVATPPEASNTPGMVAGPAVGVVDETGRFTIPAATGKVLFRQAGLVAPWALRAVMLNGVDITDMPFDADSAKEISGLEVIVYDRRPGMTGYARDSRGNLVKGYKVAVFPVNQKEGALPHRFMYTAVPDQAGRYQIGSLPAGEYVGVATEPFEQWFEWDPEFQKKVRPAAKYFKLSDGETLTIDLPYVE